MKQEDLNKMVDKARWKRDGVYSLSNHYYAIKDNCLVLTGDKINGEICQFAYGWLCKIGETKTYLLKNEIKRLMKDL